MLLPQIFLTPIVLLLISHIHVNSARGNEDQRHHVLRNAVTVYLTGIGENYVTVDEFRKQQLVDSGGSRINPAQPLCGEELLRPKRRGDHDVSICYVLFDIVIVGTVDELDIREFAPQSIYERLRRIPEREVVLRDHYDFHTHPILFTLRSCPDISFGCGTPRMPSTVGEMSCRAPSLRRVNLLLSSETTMNGTGFVV